MTNAHCSTFVLSLRAHHNRTAPSAASCRWSRHCYRGVRCRFRMASPSSGLSNSAQPALPVNHPEPQTMSATSPTSRIEAMEVGGLPATSSCLPPWLEAMEADLIEHDRSRFGACDAARAQRVINRTGGAPSAVGSLPIAWVASGQGNRELVGISRLCASIGRPDRPFVVDGNSFDRRELTSRMLAAINAAELNVASVRDITSVDATTRTSRGWLMTFAFCYARHSQKSARPPCVATNRDTYTRTTALASAVPGVQQTPVRGAPTS